jgi:hypothetical protein
VQTPEEPLRPTHLAPVAVVIRAYRAANRRRFAEANRSLTPRLREGLRSSAKSIRASNRLMLATARRSRNPKQQAELRAIVRSLRQFEDPHFCWKGSTQGGSIESIDVLKATVRKDRAFVKLALRLEGGYSRVERQRLIRGRHGWLIDTIEVGVLHNNALQLTKPAQAMELRS